ncbi:MAG: glycyl-radical enzyme activating protein, partial [Alphaproteobacteria bacterium]|nr:glycyl-radical enzyme activating protein [Alphaproteobacteria bacterium]
MVNPNKDESALIFNIQRYSVHDGPGIRTIVFLKGCPLRCPWCANPEGLDLQKTLLHNENLCSGCGRCENVCPEHAITFTPNGKAQINRQKCTLCEKCVSVCWADAFKVFGTPMTVNDILHEVIKDEVFYRRSGGGLTVSGGEPLMHSQFLSLLLQHAKEDYHLNTAIETTCHAAESSFRSVLPHLDVVLSDIKLIDPQRHRKVIGVSNETILHNLKMLTNDFPQMKLWLR